MAVLGIDLGTSGCKAVVLNDEGGLVASATASYPLSTPQPLWSEQDPADWWQGLVAAVREVMSAPDVAQVGHISGIGIGGQMHGATLLDAAGDVIRPAILWNDGRCEEQCEQLHQQVPDLITQTGNRALVGFTAPKLLWVQQHEPDLWQRVRSVLLPKDWLRFRLTGERVAEMSDGAGMLLMDVAHRRWSPALLNACHIDESYLGRLIEGTEISGMLTASAAQALGLQPGIPVVGGAGDQAAGAVGAGCVQPGDCAIALGTSGVVFTTTASYSPEPEGRLHTFCHALPDTWHQMGVMLSAAGSLQWYRDTFAAGMSFGDLCTQAAQAPRGSDGLMFLPYLTGERTPLCDARARGAFIGLTRRHDQAHCTRAVLEGISQGLAASLELIREQGTPITQATVTGGGTRSPEWMQILADVTNCRLVLREGADAGPAVGAARLALIGCQGQSISQACAPGQEMAAYEPQATAVEAYAGHQRHFADLYPAIQRYCHAVG